MARSPCLIIIIFVAPQSVPAMGQPVGYQWRQWTSWGQAGGKPWPSRTLGRMKSWLPT